MRSLGGPCPALAPAGWADGSLQALTVVLLLTLLLYAARVDPGLLRAALCYALIVLGLLAMLLLSHWHVLNSLYALSLLLYALGKALLAALELALIAIAAVPLWSDAARRSPMAASSDRSSSANTLLPRSTPLLASGLPLSIGRLHAELQGILFLGVSLLVGCLLALPLSVTQRGPQNPHTHPRGHAVTRGLTHPPHTRARLRRLGTTITRPPTPTPHATPMPLPR